MFWEVSNINTLKNQNIVIFYDIQNKFIRHNIGTIGDLYISDKVHKLFVIKYLCLIASLVKRWFH